MKNNTKYYAYCLSLILVLYYDIIFNIHIINHLFDGNTKHFSIQYIYSL